MVTLCWLDTAQTSTVGGRPGAAAFLGSVTAQQSSPFPSCNSESCLIVFTLPSFVLGFPYFWSSSEFFLASVVIQTFRVKIGRGSPPPIELSSGASQKPPEGRRSTIEGLDPTGQSHAAIL